MKILQVVHFYPPHSIGGSELYTRDLARELSRSHTVEVFCTAAGSAAQTAPVADDGVACTAIPKEYATGGNPFHERDRRVDAAFAALLDRMQPDIVHVQHLMNLSLRLPLIARRRDIAVCYTLHDFWLLCPRAFLLRADLQPCTGRSARQCCACLRQDMRLYTIDACARGFTPRLRQAVKKLLNSLEQARYYYAFGLWRPRRMRAIMRSVDRFIAPSRFLQAQYERAGLDSGKIIFLSHGISCASGRISRTAALHPRFIFIGSLRDYKGIKTLIDAFNLISKPCSLRIYGSAPAAAQRELAARCSNSNVYFMGALAEGDKETAFAGSDALIMPSLCYENAPLVILEAFAAGVPVIASGHGGMAELVRDGVNGLTFTAGNPASLAGAVARCIDDPAYLRRCAASLPPVKDMAAHAQEITAVYADILAAQRRQTEA